MRRMRRAARPINVRRRLNPKAERNLASYYPWIRSCLARGKGIIASVPARFSTLGGYAGRNRRNGVGSRPGLGFLVGRAATVPALVWKWNEGRREAPTLGPVRPREIARASSKPRMSACAAEDFWVFGGKEFRFAYV